MASIYKHISGFYYVSLGQREARISGKPKQYSLGTKNNRTAREKLSEIKKEISSATLSSKTIPSKDSILFSEAYQLMRQDRESEGQEFSKGTETVYEKAFNYFYSSCGDRPISLYTKKDFYTFTASMKDAGLKQNTQAIYAARIHAVFSWLLNEGYLTGRNPFKLIKEVQNELKIITKDELDKIFSYAKGKKFEKIIRFMFISAFRADEAINLRYEDIKENRIEVTGKGNKKSWIPITNEMRKYLKTLPKEKKGRIFDVDYYGVRKFFLRAEKKTGVKMRSHDLRKYRLSLLANRGVNIFFVKNYARHSNINTTLKYYAGVDLNKMETEINEKLPEM